MANQFKLGSGAETARFVKKMGPVPDFSVPLAVPLWTLRPGNKKARSAKQQRALPDQTANRPRRSHFGSLPTYRSGFFHFWRHLRQKGVAFQSSGQSLATLPCKSIVPPARAVLTECTVFFFPGSQN